MPRPPLSPRSGAALALALAAALAVGGAAPAPHPQDGPDVDLRIRIDETAVTVNTVVNLAFLDAVVDVFREDESALHEVEYPAVEDALLEHLRRANVLAIDGVPVDPVMEVFAVDPGDASKLPLFPTYGMRALIKVRLELSYPAKSRPGRVEMTWGSYPPSPAFAGQTDPPPLEVRAQLLVNGNESTVTFKKDAPTWSWTAGAADRADRFLPLPALETRDPRRLPLLSLGLGLGGLLLAFVVRRPRAAGLRALLLVALLAAAWAARGAGTVAAPALLGHAARLPAAAECAAVFQPLHANIYRAFDYATESEVYDALARSVDGPLLDRLYDQVHQGLVLQDDGGAVCRVQRVTPLELDVGEIAAEGGDGARFTVETRWQVYGTVFHWGHRHGRTNEYRARYEVARRAGAWRIVGTEMMEQRRISAEVLDPEPPGEPR